jgi:Domain of unknown function (DUF4272)
MTWDHEAVRAASRAALAEHGLTVPDHLPWLDRVPPRPREDVIARTLALYSVMAIVEGAPFDVVHESIVARGLDRHLSETEHRYLGARLRGEEPSERDQVELSWRGECMVALGWALELFDELPLEGHIADDSARAFGTRSGRAPARTRRCGCARRTSSSRPSTASIAPTGRSARTRSAAASSRGPPSWSPA